MTGKGHTFVGLVTSIAVYKFSKDLGLTGYIAAILSIIGSTAPDWMEIRVKSGEGCRTLIKHRTITHWLPIWIGLFIFSYFYITKEYNFNFYINEYIIEALLGFSIGGLLHLLTDLPNPQGIPILTPFSSNRFSLKLWKSGKYELLITNFFLILSLIYIDILKINKEVLLSII